MFSIAIVGSKGCNEQLIIQQLVDRTSFKVITDDDVIKWGSELYEIKDKKLLTSIFNVSSYTTFDRLRHKKHLCIFKIVLAEILIEFRKIYLGVGTYFIPGSIKNFLKLSFGADLSFRIGTYAKNERIPLHQAEKIVKEFDKTLMRFSNYYLNRPPFTPEYFDANIDVSKYKVEQITSKIYELMQSKPKETLEQAQKKMQKFITACRI
ncbi:MAG: cytidylate kinase family protein [Candidatus Kapaibacteriota bacterium]